MLETLGLANVDHFPAWVFEEIDPRLIGKSFEFFLQHASIIPMACGAVVQSCCCAVVVSCGSDQRVSRSGGQVVSVFLSAASCLLYSVFCLVLHCVKVASKVYESSKLLDRNPDFSDSFTGRCPADRTLCRP